MAAAGPTTAAGQSLGRSLSNGAFVDSNSFSGNSRSASGSARVRLPSMIGSTSGLRESDDVLSIGVSSDRVDLSDDDFAFLEKLGNAFKTDLVAQYETHVYQMRSQVDPEQWKLVKKKDGLAVHKQRKRATIVDLPVEGTDDPRAQFRSDTPSLLVVGNNAGLVDDVMFGLISATTKGMHIKSSYCQDGMDSGRVLATIQPPTAEEPYRFMGVKWVDVNYSNAEDVSCSSFVKNRDLLYLEHMGVATLSTGIKIGFHVAHSIHIESVANRVVCADGSCVRAKVSKFQIFRQRSDGRTIDVYMRGQYDPCGDMMKFMATALAADILLHIVPSTLHCGHHKKLAWMAQQSSRRRRAQTLQRETHRLTANSLDETDSEAHFQERDPVCELCGHKYGNVLQRSGAACTICSKRVCSRCSVMKKLSFVQHKDDDFMHSSGSLESEQSTVSLGPSMKEIVQKSLRFCLPCVLAATQQRASQIAVEEVLELTLDTVQPHAMPPSSRRGRAVRSSSAQGLQYAANFAATLRPKALSTTSTATSSTTASVMLYVEEDVKR